jgi:hypothetical protein
VSAFKLLIGEIERRHVKKEELPGVAIFCLKEWDIKYQIFPKSDEIQSDIPRALLVSAQALGQSLGLEC